MLNFLQVIAPATFLGATMVTSLSMFLQTMISDGSARSAVDIVKDGGMITMLLFGVLALWKALRDARSEHRTDIEKARNEHRADLKEKDAVILQLATAGIQAQTTISETNRHLVEEVRLSLLSGRGNSPK